MLHFVLEQRGRISQINRSEEGARPSLRRAFCIGLGKNRLCRVHDQQETYARESATTTI